MPAIVAGKPVLDPKTIFVAPRRDDIAPVEYEIEIVGFRTEKFENHDDDSTAINTITPSELSLEACDYFHSCLKK